MAFFGGGFEWAVRPFAQRDSILQRYIDSRPPEADNELANIRWGAKSTFGFRKGSYVTAPGVHVTFPPDEPETPDESPEEITLDFTEVSREETEERRVENPDDSEQYVNVKDVTVWLAEGPDIRPDSMLGPEGRRSKIYWRFTFTPPEE